MKKQAVISKMLLQEGMDDTRLLGGGQTPVSQSSSPLCCWWALEVGISPSHPQAVQELCSAAAFPDQEQLCHLSSLVTRCSAVPGCHLCPCWGEWAGSPIPAVFQGSCPAVLRCIRSVLRPVSALGL